jgi:hypothetical protein
MKKQERENFLLIALQQEEFQINFIQLKNARRQQTKESLIEEAIQSK